MFLLCTVQQQQLTKFTNDINKYVFQLRKSFQPNFVDIRYYCIRETEPNEVKCIFKTKLVLIQLISNDSVILQFIYKQRIKKSR